MIKASPPGVLVRFLFLCLVTAPSRAQECLALPTLEQVGAGTAGVAGPLLLSSAPPVVGAPFSVSVSGGAPQSHGCVIFGPSGSPLALPAFGGTLYPALPSYFALTFVSSGDGSAGPLFHVASVPAWACGFELVMQAVVVDSTATGGVALSNGLRVVFGLNPLGAISGSVVDLIGAGVSGAEVETSAGIAVVSAPDGTFSIVDHPSVPGVTDLFVTSVIGPVTRIGFRLGVPVLAGGLSSVAPILVDGDFDGDGLPNAYETQVFGSNPLLEDTDGVGVDDGVEVIDHGSDPTLTDTDGDGLDDGAEVRLGTSLTHPNFRTDLRGTVRFTDGTPAVGSEIRVLGIPMSLFSTTSGPRGNFILTGWPIDAPTPRLFGIGVDAHSVSRRGFLDVVGLTARAENLVGELVLDAEGDLGFPGRRFSVGPRPRSVALGDFDGDGLLDALVANGNSADVSLLLGGGADGFAAHQIFGVGSIPVSIALGDLDGDGLLDAVVANSGSSDLSLLLGDGAGGFAAEQRFGVGSIPVSIALGDLDEDGLLDAVVANLDSSDISLLRGDGAGGFAVEQRFGMLNAPQSVALGDVDGDGSLDAVVANGFGLANDITLLLGDGAGGFAAEHRFGVGRVPLSVALGDVDGDGMLDAVVANSNTNDISLLRGDGAGGFAAEQRFDVGSRPQSIVLGDVDGDGLLDAVVANRSTNDISLLLGDGAGGFVGAQQFGTGNNPASLALGDVDGDGLLDAVAVNRDSDAIALLLGGGSEGFIEAERFFVGSFPQSVALGDLDGDGFLDLGQAWS